MYQKTIFDSNDKIKEAYVNVYQTEKPFGFVYDFPVYPNGSVAHKYRIHVIPKLKTDPKLLENIKNAIDNYDNMPEKQKQEMEREQRNSFIKSIMDYPKTDIHRQTFGD